MERIHKSTMLKVARENGKIEVYASGNKVNAYHINNGWMLGYSITVTAKKDSGKWIYTVDRICDTDNEISLETYCDNILCYLPSELGTRVVFWKD